MSPLNKDKDQLYNSLFSPTCTLTLCILSLKQHLPCQWIPKWSFLEQIMGYSPEIIQSLILILNLKSFVNTGPGLTLLISSYSLRMGGCLRYLPLKSYLWFFEIQHCVLLCTDHSVRVYSIFPLVVVSLFKLCNRQTRSFAYCN
mgnify:CR=1 FL=1